MKKKSFAEKVCEPRTEYNLGELLPEGVQGKYVERYCAGTNIVLLDPEVAKAFPTQESVNQALRLVMQLAGIAQPMKTRVLYSSAKKQIAHSA